MGGYWSSEDIQEIINCSKITAVGCNANIPPAYSKNEAEDLNANTAKAYSKIEASNPIDENQTTNRYHFRVWSKNATTRKNIRNEVASIFADSIVDNAVEKYLAEYH